MQLACLGIVFLVIILLLAKRRPLYQAIFGGLVVTVVLFRIPPAEIIHNTVKVFTNWSSVSVLISLYLMKECYETLIVGDGETNEGQVWEAFTFASAHNLGNLVVMIDWNKRQLDGYCEDIYPAANFHEKMAAFGFNTVTINGNDVEAVAKALEATRAGGEKPWAIVLDTVKGAGIPDVEQTLANHSMSVGDAAYEKWTAELRRLVAELEG